MFYFLTVGYDIPNLCMDDTSDLYGPYKTAKARDKSLKELLSEVDLETSTILNVTKLVIEDGKLVSEESFVADGEEIEEDE